jgi:hypothetical protein
MMTENIAEKQRVDFVGSMPVILVPLLIGDFTVEPIDDIHSLFNKTDYWYGNSHLMTREGE